MQPETTTTPTSVRHPNDTAVRSLDVVADLLRAERVGEITIERAGEDSAALFVRCARFTPAVAAEYRGKYALCVGPAWFEPSPFDANRRAFFRVSEAFYGTDDDGTTNFERVPEGDEHAIASTFIAFLTATAPIPTTSPNEEDPRMIHHRLPDEGATPRPKFQPGERVQYRNSPEQTAPPWHTYVRAIRPGHGDTVPFVYTLEDGFEVLDERNLTLDTSEAHYAPKGTVMVRLDEGTHVDLVDALGSVEAADRVFEALRNSAGYRADES
jgi:hypothetical protein